jgi:hypothetical protein
VKYLFNRVVVNQFNCIVQVVPHSDKHSVPDLRFPSVGLSEQADFLTYLRDNVTSLPNESRASVERDLRALEIQQKMGHGLFVLSKAKHIPWRIIMNYSNILATSMTFQSLRLFPILRAMVVTW